MARKKQYVKKLFESDCTSADTFAGIYNSMLLSEAWLSLTVSQQVLYLVCKAQYYAQKRKPEGAESFFMNKFLWCEKYALYTANNNRGFYRDMSALIEKGFVRCVNNGATTREKNVYKFSSMWQHYGTNNFVVGNSDRSIAAIHRSLKA